jgi:hypothetical protein
MFLKYQSFPLPERTLMQEVFYNGDLKMGKYPGDTGIAMFFAKYPKAQSYRLAGFFHDAEN